MLRSKSQSITLTHISLALVGLMWVFPFLHYYHKHPITTFYQEWWSALFGVLALSGLLTRDYWRQAEIPRIVQLPVALIAVVLLQMALGMMAFAGQGLLYTLYLLLAALLMMLGAHLRDYFTLGKLALILATFLLAGAELNALIGVLQHYRWHTPLDSVIVTKVSASMYGNLAQPNHFADYLALGLVSLGLLLQRCRLSKAYVLLLALPLLFAMTLSGSRSTWLYLLMLFALSWRAGRSKPELSVLWRYSLLLLVGFVAMHLFVRLPFMAGPASVNTMQRLFGSDASGSIRLYLWHEAWLMFVQSPWLGAGFGQFAWQHFQMGVLLQRTNITGLYNNAHNLIFQLAAEAGIAGLTVLFASLGVWLNGLRRASWSAAHWWGYAVLGVLAIHSFLEYPLWYVYFLAIAAVLLGMMDETRYRIEMRNVGRGSMLVIVLMGLLALIQLRIGYQKLEVTLGYRATPDKAAESYRRTWDDLRVIQEVPLLRPHAEYFMSALMEVNGEQAIEKLAINTQALRFIPIGSAAYRQALLLAENGQLEQAKLIWEQAVWSYPYAKSEYVHLQSLAEKDPAHFAALLEFALIKEQEYARAVHNK